MANSKNPLSSSSLWKTAWIATMACKKSIGTLLFAGIFLPRALLDFIYDDKSILLSKSLQLMASDNQKGIMDFISEGSNYYSTYLGLSFATWLLSLGIYFSVVFIVVSWHRQQVLSIQDALSKGLRCIFPKGFVLAASGMSVLIIGQVLTAPAFILAILGLMAPVIIVTRSKGAASSVWDSFTVRYSRGTPYSGWSVMFTLMSVGAMFYALLIVSALAGDLFLNLDHYIGIKRSLWVSESVLSSTYLLSILAQNLISVCAVGLLPGLTTALYFAVTEKKDVAVA
jgi:hypothetical protein